MARCRCLCWAGRMPVQQTALSRTAHAVLGSNNNRQSLRPLPTRLSKVRSWPSWTWVRTRLAPWVQVSGPVRSGPAPDFVGPGPGGEWTGPWGWTRVGPGPNLYFQFIILCTVSNIILSFCNHFQKGGVWNYSCITTTSQRHPLLAFLPCHYHVPHIFVSFYFIYSF